MLVLAATDTIAAGANTASKLTCTIFGMELNGGSEVYSVLYQGQLGNSVSTIYTVPSSTQTFIRSISIVNTDVLNAYTFQVFRGGTAAANAITPLYSIPAGSIASYEDGVGWRLVNKYGQILEVPLSGDLEPQPNWGIYSVKAETIPRYAIQDNNLAWSTTGTFFMQIIWLQAGMVLKGTQFCCGTTGSLGQTWHQMGLYDINRNLLRGTNDYASSGNVVANSPRNFYFTSLYTVPTTGLYYLGMGMVASTMCSAIGSGSRTGGQLGGTAPICSGLTSDAGIGALPNPAGAITAGLNNIWMAVT